jgi:alpha-tubulin suppressor-like RCC1 family protein
MTRVIQLSAGPSRSVVLADDGAAWVWGNVGRQRPAGPDGRPQDLCGDGAVEVGHGRYAQPLPRTLRASGRMSSVSDAATSVVAVVDRRTVVALSPIFGVDGGTPSVPIDGAPPDIARFATMESSTLALTTGGQVWSWGMNPLGQLGRESGLIDARPGPVDLPAGIEMIAAGSHHGLALDRRGGVWAWGANAAGQLGTGSLEPSRRPLLVDLPVKIRAIAAGVTHSLAIDDRGRCWGWGSNHLGQLTGAATSGVDVRYQPRPVRLALGFPVIQVDAGMHYSVALTQAGEVCAWGWNGLGQLGVDGGASSAQPIRLGQLARIGQIAAGPCHVLAVGEDGLHAWGDNRTAACGCPATQRVVAVPVRIELT